MNTLRFYFGGLIGLLYLFCVLSAESFRFQRQATNCETARREPGSCINIKRCQLMLKLLKESRNDRNTLDYLRGSMCGYEGNDPKVCCPMPEEEEMSSRTQDFHNLPNPPNCGTSSAIDLPRIVGGRPSELGSWPWITALGYRNRTSRTPEWLCGGALVSDRYIITAAHCNKHPRLSMYIARMGDLDLNPTVQDGASPVDILIEKVIPHEKYSSTKFTDDIALVKLTESVKFTSLIQPICLPKSPELRSNDFNKYTPFIAGWGSVSFRGPSSSALLEIQLPVVENQKCQDAYRPKKAVITPNQLCAGISQGGKDACQGDSGGPMMLPKGTSFYLIGVVSYGYKCAEPGFPGVFTRVTNYVDWISRNMV